MGNLPHLLSDDFSTQGQTTLKQSFTLSSSYEGWICGFIYAVDMTPIRLRLLVVTFIVVAAAISINALYMQDASRLAVASTGKPTATESAPPALEKPAAPVESAPVDVAVLSEPIKEERSEPEIAPAPPAEKKAQRQPSEIDAALETVASLGNETASISPQRAEAAREELEDGPPSPRVISAIKRELNFHGYQAGPEDGELTEEMQAAIVSYEFDMGRPLTGRPSNALLKSLLFDAVTTLPTPSARPHFENSQKLITAVQDVLSRMGYGASSSSGYLDEATRYAISKFEADRDMEESGRLSARLLLEILIVTGEPITIPG